MEMIISNSTMPRMPPVFDNDDLLSLPWVHLVALQIVGVKFLFLIYFPPRIVDGTAVLGILRGAAQCSISN